MRWTFECKRDVDNLYGFVLFTKSHNLLLFSNGIQLKTGMSFPGYQTANKEELGIDWLYFFVVVRHAIKSCPSFFVDGTYQQPSPRPLLPTLYIIL